MEQTEDWWADIEEDGIDGELRHFWFSPLGSSSHLHSRARNIPHTIFPLSFSGSNSPMWDFQMDCAIEPALLDPIPPDLAEFNDIPLLDLDVSREKEAPLKAGEREKWQMKNKLNLEDISKYFHRPITAAAKELNTGVTQLKKRCRELGIPRWPQPKFKSFSSLIANVKELVQEEGETGESKLQRTREILEREMQAMVRAPGMEMEDETKRLWHACFKAAFKKRKMNSHVTSRKVPHGSSSSSPTRTGASPGKRNVLGQRT